MVVSILGNEASSTKQHINACWQAQPSLNPAAFREVLSYTVGKLWLDLRSSLPAPSVLQQAWQQGLNGWLLSPHTYTALSVPLSITRDTLVLALENHTPTLPTGLPLDLFFWRTATPTLEGFATLENTIKEHHLTAYGLATETAMSLDTSVALAEAAAHQVYGRHKRPGLRALLVPLNLTETAWLHQPLTIHHAQPVSGLEYAARLGWAVVAEHTPHVRRDDGLRIPLTSSFAPPAAALQALEATVIAEQALHHALQGWPTVGGQPLFNLLAPLSAGEPPFATREIGSLWATHFLPELVQTWQSLPGVSPALLTPYIESLQRLAAHAPALGQAAAAQTTARFLEVLPSSQHTALQANPGPNTFNLVTSLPGVTAGLVAPEDLEAFLSLMTQPDHPDPAPYFISTFPA